MIASLRSMPRTVKGADSPRAGDVGLARGDGRHHEYDRLGPPVPAGPVEATALGTTLVTTTLGNVLVQGRAPAALSGTLEDLRSFVARTHPPLVHHPTSRGAPL